MNNHKKELERLIDEIPELIKLHWRTPNEGVWTNKVLRFLKKSFGEDSDFYQQFHHAVYNGGGIAVTENTPDSYFQNNRNERIQEYHLLLKSFLDEIDQTEESKIQSNQEDFLLKLKPDLLISKFKQCLKELDNLYNAKDDQILKIIHGGKIPVDEQKLLEISKRIRNLLRVGYTDGVERSEHYTIEGGNFYKNIQRERKPFEPVSDLHGSIFLQHLNWHRIKVKEYLDEIELIKEALGNVSVTSEPNQNEVYLKIQDYPEPFYRTLVDRINKLYYQDFFPESLLLIRKLFENLVIDILKKKYPDETSLYIGTHKKHHKFHIIIKNLNEKIDKGDFDNSKNELLEAVSWASKLRDEGGKSSHSLTFDVDKPYLDQIAQQVQRNTELLIRVFNLIK